MSLRVMVSWQGPFVLLCCLIVQARTFEILEQGSFECNVGGRVKTSLSGERELGTRRHAAGVPETTSAISSGTEEGGLTQPE
jgi:hypothetical protein